MLFMCGHQKTIDMSTQKIYMFKVEFQANNARVVIFLESLYLGVNEFVKSGVVEIDKILHNKQNNMTNIQLISLYLYNLFWKAFIFNILI